jgi:hypothetical protein
LPLAGRGIRVRPRVPLPQVLIPGAATALLPPAAALRWLLRGSAVLPPSASRRCKVVRGHSPLATSVRVAGRFVDRQRGLRTLRLPRIIKARQRSLEGRPTSVPPNRATEPGADLLQLVLLFLTQSPGTPNTAMSRMRTQVAAERALALVLFALRPLSAGVGYGMSRALA